MTTIVNTPPTSNDNGGMGVVVGLLALVVGVYLFFVYALPAIRQMQIGTPQITIPAKIDVNVQPQQVQQ